MRRRGAERLVARGKVIEWSGDLMEAATCYRRALGRPGKGEAAGRPGADHQVSDHQVSGPQVSDKMAGRATGQGIGVTREALERLAGVAGRMPIQQVGGLRAELERASASGVAAADWALGRFFLSQGDEGRALERIERYLARAPAEAPEHAAAGRARAEILAERERAALRLARRRLALGLGGAGLVAVLALLWLRGVPLDRALARCPALFPEVARTIAELRHDVLKHRTSVLGLGATGEAARAEVARVLWEPERASEVVTAAYERLRRAGQGRGGPAATARP